jgi:hypothetical protein
MMQYPHDPETLSIWMMAIALVYFGVAIFVLARRKRSDDFTYWMKSILDGVLFASSAILLWGVFDKSVLALFSELTTFLIIGGMGGLAWGFYSLVHGK